MPLSNIHILHQDNAVLVVNKPTLLLSVPGRADDNKDCLITRLQENGYPEARIVHRLDWETSGIILLARDADTHRELSRHFTTAKQKRPTPPCAGASRNWTAAASTCRCAMTHRPNRGMWWTTSSASMR